MHGVLLKVGEVFADGGDELLLGDGLGGVKRAIDHGSHESGGEYGVAILDLDLAP